MPDLRQRLVWPHRRSGATASSRVSMYPNAYRVGTALIGLGNAIKIFCWGLGVVILVGWLTAADGPSGGAAVVGVLFWICGVMVAAQSQFV